MGRFEKIEKPSGAGGFFPEGRPKRSKNSAARKSLSERALRRSTGPKIGLDTLLRAAARQRLQRRNLARLKELRRLAPIFCRVKVG